MKSAEREREREVDREGAHWSDILIAGKAGAGTKPTRDNAPTVGLVVRQRRVRVVVQGEAARPIIPEKLVDSTVVDHKEVDDLFNEATMPIEAVMAQNGSSDSDNTEIASSRNNEGGQSTKTSSSHFAMK